MGISLFVEVINDGLYYVYFTSPNFDATEPLRIATTLAPFFCTSLRVATTAMVFIPPASLLPTAHVTFLQLLTRQRHMFRILLKELAEYRVQVFMWWFNRILYRV